MRYGVSTTFALQMHQLPARLFPDVFRHTSNGGFRRVYIACRIDGDAFSHGAIGSLGLVRRHEDRHLALRTEFDDIAARLFRSNPSPLIASLRKFDIIIIVRLLRRPGAQPDSVVQMENYVVSRRSFARYPLAPAATTVVRCMSRGVDAG